MNKDAWFPVSMVQAFSTSEAGFLSLLSFAVLSTVL